MASTDRLERLTDLVLVLLGANRPLSLQEIARDVPGYPDNRDARRQAFERDKQLLRREGIPVATEPIEGAEQFGYRIRSDEFYLPDLHLDPDERAALHLAVAGVHLGDPSGRDALLKLGATGVAEARPLASFAPPPAIGAVFEAVRTGASLAFSYHDEQRTIAPARLWFRDGRWYALGWDHGREAVRTFRVDRMEEPLTVGPPESGAAAEGLDPALLAPAEPWEAAADEGDVAEVLLWVDAVEGPRVVEEVGERVLRTRHADGSVTLALRVASVAALRTWVLGLLDHAEVLDPPAYRQALVSWLEEMVAAPAVGGAGAEADPEGAGLPATGSAAAPAESAPDDKTPGRRRGAVRDVRERLRRLLAVVGWLAEVGEAPIEEISQRFAIPAGELVDELELAACCGTPPYSPDTLMEIVVTDHTVQAFLPEELSRPRRLTAAEGFALATAARTILAVPGADETGALARALAKLDQVMGDRQRLVVDIPAPPLLDDVRQATAEHRRLSIEYHSASRDETTRRIVDPVRVISLDGHWYLDAYCHRAGDVRRFRVDRLRAVAPTGDADGAPRPLDPLPSEAFVPGPGARLVRLEVDAAASWVADSLPVGAVEELGGGARRVSLAVGGTAWLERLLLQAGRHARVLDPPELVGTGAAAARRVLARYRGDRP